MEKRASLAATTVEVLPRPSPMLTGMAYAASDLLTLMATAMLAEWSWRLVNPLVPALTWEFLPALLLFGGVYALFGLYPATGITAVEVFRRLVMATGVVYLILTAAIFLQRDLESYSRGVFVVAGALSVITVPMARAMLCHFVASAHWFGAPVLVLGAGRTGATVIRQMKANRSLGYKAVACLDDDPEKWGVCEGVPVIGPLALSGAVGHSFRIHHAVLAMPGAGRERMLELLEMCSAAFRKVIVIPDLFGMSTLWVSSRDLGGILGLELRYNLLVPLNRGIKRMLDVVLAAVAGTVALPLVAVAAVWVRLASRGPAFYYQEREGEKQSVIRIPKLRTMHDDAEFLLFEYLARDSGAAAEWNRFFKLKNDPRVIPGIGRLLRRTSLDELPQLWLVLKGEMSLVGPRPFPAYHNEKFGPEFRRLRRQVKPGLTGLWQISDRSDGDLGVQQQLDTYYIKNWSIWLDLYILSRTVRAVVFPRGAY